LIKIKIKIKSKAKKKTAASFNCPNAKDAKVTKGRSIRQCAAQPLEMMKDVALRQEANQQTAPLIIR